ncbi:MAG: hypothetical protein KGO81_10910 [Bacteroidota bacterium]|nr:hypothetical protein [Bacteroidota bacterium]
MSSKARQMIHYCSIQIRWILLLLLLPFSTAFSQKITATLDHDKILIGEQVELTITVKDIDTKSVALQQWINLPDTFHHLEVVKRLPIDTINIDALTTYEQKILLTSFDSGYWQIPSQTVSFSDKQTIHTNPLNITVLPANVKDLKEYHDIKDIVEVEPEKDWNKIILYAGGSVVLLLILFILYRLLKRKRPKRSAVPVKPQRTEDIIQQLEALLNKGLIEKEAFKIFFSEITMLCRNFSDQRLHTATADKTTDEYMLLIKGKVGTEPVQTQYFQLLRMADAVKFAKYTPSKETCIEAVQSAITFVKTIDQFRFQQKNNA